MNASRRTSLRTFAIRRARRAQAVIMRPRVPIVGPLTVLHILVGAMTLVTAHALFSPLARPVVYAEQSRSQTPAVSAPALSTTASSPTTQQTAPGGNVLTDLSVSIGRTSVPSIETWRGMAGQEVNRRSAPNRSKPPVGTLQAGSPVEVVRWVRGEEVEPRNDTWAELSDGTYVFSTSLRRTGTPAPGPIPADAPSSGRWIDVDLGQQIATAYEGTTALRTVLISSGQPGWDTPTGVFPVLRRLEKDTMDGSTLLGQGPDGKGADYKVENVRHVQYFTSDGAAIHENYWRRPATFGMPGSHGCIGMLPADAAWFWEFATVGTPLVIHE